jgi:hypothetical protein|tara:strand:- start:423 stop:1964 length:1542 start_codon:yes stop_codon:yes gene_type:complete
MALTFTTSTSSAQATVNDANHGAIAGSFVTFSNANTGNSDLNTKINNEFSITSITDANSYVITLSGNADAALSSAGSADAEYQINIGINTVVPGDGWGAGTWGADGWGSASSETAGGGTLRLWSQDNFGEDLIFNNRDGFVFYWDKSLGLTSRAKNLLELSDAAPKKSRKVMVSERDRHVICFGANPIDSAVQDRMLIRFSHQENPFLWTPTATNTAGDLRLGSGSEIITAVKTRREMIVLTDTAVFSMQFIGPPFTFGVNQLASNTTVKGFNAAVAVGDSVFWMGYDRFYIYDGRVQVIPCSVRDHVFQDFNETQSDKVYAGVNSAFGEVFWFYPSESNSGANGGTDENDKYVIYNYDEKVWYVGSLSRTSWVDRGVYQYPMATDSNLVYNHEKGNDNDGTAFTSFIESSPIDVQDGDQFVFLRRMIPDVSFDKSDSGLSNDNKQATFSLKAQRSPGGGFIKTSTNTVTSDTELNHLRLRGRSFGLRVESTTQGVNWRLGTPRVDLRADGDR